MHSLHRGGKIVGHQAGTTEPGSPRGDRRSARVATGTSMHGPLDRRILQDESMQPLLCDRILPASPTRSTQLLHDLTPEERREEREFQLQMAKLQIEAERAEAAAERALAEKKLLLAHELSLQELDIKSRQSDSSSDGGSIHAGPAGERKGGAPERGGISPFELLYGYPVRGPLSIVKVGWEKAPKKPPQDVVSYMLALHNQTQHFWKQAKSNLEASQEVMKEWYDQKATLVEFSPGDKVWVMEPVEPRALQDRWTGPFEIKERKGEATYLVDFKIPRNLLRVLHHTRLKPHFERTGVTMLLVTDDGMEEESGREEVG
ncbi:hypothetical protein NDU88_003632 [Pleurodeles waltl]|uniref:Uncharacterized protein n=1 Tax=Pleurodeles waltl TaxID=8319 RepID=A0AAV7PCR8_PLEWA|nr:hypothetical protein NDU88_003632 [Pleurodeles waltl]